MGCQPSSQTNSQKPLKIYVSVIDPAFGDETHSQTRSHMRDLEIYYEHYVSLNCFVEEVNENYVNEVIVVEEMLPRLQKQLKRLRIQPNLYVIDETMDSEAGTLNKHEQPYRKYRNYKEVLQRMSEKVHLARNSCINPHAHKGNLDVKVFRKFDKTSTENMIIESTLKSKGLSYEIYHTYAELEESVTDRPSSFIVTDYLHHREVVSLVRELPRVRVICFVEEIDQQKSFDSAVYFVADNFLEIASEISSESKLRHLNQVPCTKVFIHTGNAKFLESYKQFLENFKLSVKVEKDIVKIIKESRYFFAVTIIVSPQNRKDVERRLESQDFLFRAKLLEIKEDTESDMKGLRRILKEIKKGYRAEKGLTRSVDVIDKHFENAKFEGIKKELEKNSIKCYGFADLSAYIKQKRLMSSFIICNYEERSLLARYLKESKFKAKVIIFCNKNNITSDLKECPSYAFVSSHFGKILKFIKKTPVYNPLIADEAENRIKDKKEQLKTRNKRISALKWCGISEPDQRENLRELEKSFEFLNTEASTHQSQIREIQRDSAGFFKLDYRPTDRPQQFKRDLAESFRRLREIYRIDYPESEFEALVASIEDLSTRQLLGRVSEFFSSQNELGLRINSSLVDLSKMTKQQISSIREFLYVVNLSYLSPLRMPAIGRTSLYHYMDCGLIENCQLDSYLLNKNYYVFYEKTQQLCKDHLSKYRIDCELEFNTMGESDPTIGSYFRYADKFIFPPFSQFLIRKIEKQSQELTVITIEYKKNVDFLKAYYSDNLVSEGHSLLETFQKEVEKHTLSDEGSLLVDSSNQREVEMNIQRSKTLMDFRAGDVQSAIPMQRELIKDEENLQNFDPQKLEWLHYELACSLFKAQSHEECRKLLEDLLDSEPSSYLRQKIKLLLNYYKEREETKSTRNIHQSQKEDEEMLKVVNLEQSQCHITTAQLEEDSCCSSEDFKNDNVFSHQEQACNEFPCMEMDRIEDFEEFKENLA